MSRALAFPYTLDAVGVVDAATVANKIYLDRVLTLLSTNIGQRPMLPSYGTDLDKALFENENNFGPAVQQAIGEAIKTWLPDVIVQDIQISELDAGVGNVQVTLELPGNTLTTLNISTSTFSYDGTITR
jgi:phage baseplate assembly protein W